jgi:hypothetical protein
MVAAIRPDSWNYPLLLHVLGATVLVGAVTAAAVALLVASRFEESAYLRRVGFRTLLYGALPAFIIMRVGGEWLRSKEFGDAADEPTWLGIGYGIADAGGVVLLITLILSGIGASKSKPGLSKAAGILAAVTLVAWLVAIWAMGAKPS